MPASKISRRKFVNSCMGSALIGVATVPFTGLALGSENVPVLTEEGLHYQPWFLESFLDLSEDAAAAREANKHFAIIWELRGCPYCAKTHEMNFSNERIRRFIQKNFDVLQLNIIGSKLVTDFDGEEISEKKLAAKYGVRFTPTIQFFSSRPDDLVASPPKQREATRFSGYLEQKQFLSMFQYVAEKAYRTKTFREYLASH